MSDQRAKFSDKEALLFHSANRPGKLEIIASKPMATQRDLSLAYSPGVAVPVEAIAADATTAYDYTAKGNLVAVISNGTAILGLGNLGAIASKPVMEGKAVLFKRFADVDSIDLEVDSEDVDKFCDCVALLEPSFGGVNLEDIAAPECFIIEQRLRERMNIPVFHDDQHGTAIITAAGLINAVHLSGRSMQDTRVVMNGAGAASIACAELIKAKGVPGKNISMCDRKGVIYKGREAGMNQWKSAYAIETDCRSLAEAMEGSDVFIGLSVKDAVTKDMVASMADNPIIFAMANPDPEISPEDVRAVRDDAIIATGRSDYPNQVNNVLGFPYIFRGARDVRATTINDEMKIAAAEGLAELAREDVPDEVASAYSGARPTFGPDYIIPAPFDPRLIEFIPPKVAQAAMDTGVARRPILDMESYKTELKTRLNPTVATMTQIYDKVRRNPKRVVFAEAEEEKVLRAAINFQSDGYGEPILVGRTDRVEEQLKKLGYSGPALRIENSRESAITPNLLEFLYGRLQRQGYLYRDCQRLVNQDRNVFSACLVAMGEADAMVTGVTRHYHQALDQVKLALDTRPGEVLFGMHVVVARSQTIFIADSTVNERPTAEQLAKIAIEAAAAVRKLGHEPRVAFLSHSNFGSPAMESSVHVREAVALLDQELVDFEYEGELSSDVALNQSMMDLYPFSRLSGRANVLIMPALHSANISAKILKEIGDSRVIGPLLVGLEKPVEIAAMTASMSDLVNLAVIGAAEVI
ncbi:MAG: NADP-dependent malic enzyme [Sphingomonadales bacterium]